jgi:hypothetical protein
VNLSTPRPKGRGLLEVHPEPRLSTPRSKAGLRAAERVKNSAAATCAALTAVIRSVRFFLSSNLADDGDELLQ